jgi:4-hydroxybenzoyl-CoA thioesterase
VKGINLASSPNREKDTAIIYPTDHWGSLTFPEISKIIHEGGNGVMPFRKPIKVCFGDIDNAGIVYYPRFMHYFHLAMEEFFSSEMGIDYADVLHQRKLSLPTVHVEANFRRRMRYGDQINIEVRVVNVGQTSITWGYRGYRMAREEEMVVEGQNVTVCIHPDTFEKTDLPEWLRKGLTAYKERLND